MAKTLFFLEALGLAALAGIFPFLASDLAGAFLLPLALALLLPLLASLAVRPAKEVWAGLACAFAGRRPAGPSAEAASVLRDLSAFALRGGILGFLVFLVLALPRLGGAEARTWLVLGAFWTLFALLGMLASQALALVVGRLSAIPPNRDSQGPGGQAFASRHGLTAREWEVAALIASGSSYKECADRLCISVKTVKAHIAKVYRKTRTGDRVALVLLLRAETEASASGAVSKSK